MTESNQGNSINVTKIYNAICSLDAEDQGVILNSFKFPEIGCIFRDFKTYNQYNMDLINSANQYLQISKALSNLYKAIQKAEEIKESALINAMEDTYDSMSSESQKIFCENMTQKPGYFCNAYEAIMAQINQAVKEDQRGEVGQ